MQTDFECDDILVDMLPIGSSEDEETFAHSSFWIPFSATTCTHCHVEQIRISHSRFTVLHFDVVPTVKQLKFALLRVLMKSAYEDGQKLVTHLWAGQPCSERRANILRLIEMLYFTKHSLSLLPDRECICVKAFNFDFCRTITKIDLLIELILRQVTIGSTYPVLPKWKGKPTQFIELISIGIELGLFEGQNQNQICNSLLKAFQVDAESDEPIYKQRFNALFKRSKLHLPLIASYISRIEETKQMKVLFQTE